LGFGREVDPQAEEKGILTNSDLLGMKISIFDVSNVEKPQETHKIIIGDHGSSSEILRNHKALLFDKNKRILAFPVTVKKEIKDNQERHYTQTKTTFMGAHVYNFDLEDGFSLRGKVTHYEAEDFNFKGNYFNGDHNLNISRIIYIGENFYTISPNVVKASDFNSLKENKKITLDEIKCNQIYMESRCEREEKCQAVYRRDGECRKNEDGTLECEDVEIFQRCEDR